MTTPLAHVLADVRYAWYGPSMLVATPRGECVEDHRLTGYYFREARHLSVLRLELNGTAPWLCADSSTNQRQLDFVLVYPELTRFGGGGTDVSDDTTWTDAHGVPQRAVDVRLSLRLRWDGLDVQLTLANRSRSAVELRIAWILDADFADVQEAFSGEREQRGEVRREPVEGGVCLRYVHPRLALATRITAAGGEGGAWQLGDDRLVRRVRLEPQSAMDSVLTITAIDGADPADGDAAGGAHGDALRARRLQAWSSACTGIDIPRNGVLEQLVRQAAADVGSLALLDGAEDEWLTPQAGIPLYPALFGRDAFTAGWQAAMLDEGELTAAALTRVARLQSHRTDDWRDEQPGRIPYQVRRGPLARLDITPYSAYYADFASPFMYIIALGHRFAWSGDERLLERHWDTACRLLDWAREYGDADGDGYLEYQTRSSRGTKNQGWKDSGNAIVYEDGRPVPAPLGTCELQGYWFAAQQVMAALNWARGGHEDARALWHASQELKARFNRDWWMEEAGFYALAMDADKRLARSITSNVGHCLATGIIDDERVPRVVDRLFAPDLFSGWAVRTLAATHPAYNPLGYHLGSVWPVENASIVFGLKRYGFDARAIELAGGLFDLGQLYELGRTPECVGGYARTEFPQPGAYPRANPVQLWNQSAYIMLLQALLGLQPVAPLHTLGVDPVLPPWLPEITLRRLRLGGATATLRFVRGEDAHVDVDVVERQGTLHLVRQPPPESLHTSAFDRVRAFLGGLGDL
ncbi:MAG TPA: glycogen debranching N-terminal domain-containing protein [Gemmatimonadaceae bacterium]|nr:glycogen debranching N-terminal domain-containing protein [Gemmatimonadaceae bacterium]